MHCRSCGKKGVPHLPETMNGVCLDCGKRVGRGKKPPDEILVDGIVWGTGLFAVAAIAVGAWENPWNLLLAWAGGVTVQYLVEKFNDEEEV